MKTILITLFTASFLSAHPHCCCCCDCKDEVILTDVNSQQEPSNIPVGEPPATPVILSK